MLFRSSLFRRFLTSKGMSSGRLSEARVPGRRREIAEAMIAASLRRSEASGGIEQVARDALAIVELERVRMVPRDGDPLGGFG